MQKNKIILFFLISYISLNLYSEQSNKNIVHSFTFMPLHTFSWYMNGGTNLNFEYEIAFSNRIGINLSAGYFKIPENEFYHMTSGITYYLYNFSVPQDGLFVSLDGNVYSLEYSETYSHRHDISISSEIGWRGIFGNHIVVSVGLIFGKYITIDEYEFGFPIYLGFIF